MNALTSADAVPGHLYRRPFGELCRVKALARHADDLTPLVVYEHLWPFETHVWVEPLANWAVQANPIDQAELDSETAKNRFDAQTAFVMALAAKCQMEYFTDIPMAVRELTSAADVRAAEAVPGQLYQHTDGGIYRVTALTRCAQDLGPLVIYEHMWPHETATWARPLSEWGSRFTPIAQSVLESAQGRDRAAAQAAIALAKAARRQRERFADAGTA